MRKLQMKNGKLVEFLFFKNILERKILQTSHAMVSIMFQRKKNNAINAKVPCADMTCISDFMKFACILKIALNVL